MKDWNVAIEVVRPQEMALDDLADAIINALGDVDAAATMHSDRASVSLTVQAYSISGAAALALEKLQKAGSDLEVISLRVVPEDASEATKDESSRESLVGVTEIAGILKLTKQRVSELAKEGRLPEPVARLKSGPVWRLQDLEAFLRTPRKPGRPVASPGKA